MQRPSITHHIIKCVSLFLRKFGEIIATHKATELVWKRSKTERVWKIRANALLISPNRNEGTFELESTTAMILSLPPNQKHKMLFLVKLSTGTTFFTCFECIHYWAEWWYFLPFEDNVFVCGKYARCVCLGLLITNGQFWWPVYIAIVVNQESTGSDAHKFRTGLHQKMTLQTSSIIQLSINQLLL